MEDKTMLKAIAPLRFFGFPLLICSLATPLAFQSHNAQAQVIERGVQGGVVGAIIGGIVGGGRGAGTGAAIGAGVGVVAGAAERDANARAAYGPPAYYGPPPGPGGGGLVYDTQAALARLGYDPGPVDGMYGQRTADAISQFQVYNRLPVDGRPSPALLDMMVRQGG